MFDDEGACPRYWMFSGFINMSSIIVLPHLDKLVSVHCQHLFNGALCDLFLQVSECLRCLATEESVLYSHLKSIGAISHLKSIGAISHALPLTR